MSRSRNSYIRAPRSVTFAPMGTPSRSLKFAIDFFARVTIGFCPVIDWRSAVAKSSTLAFSRPSPTPMLITTFSTRGTCHGFVYPRSDRLLSRDRLEIGRREVEHLGVLPSLADAHVDHDLLDARHLPRIRVPAL